MYSLKLIKIYCQILIIFLIVFSHREAKAERIVSLAPVITEIVLALERGEDLVGVTDICQIPSNVKAKRLGSYQSLSAEAVVSLNPDIVLSMKGQKSHGKYFDKLGIKSIEIELNSLEDIFKSVEEIAKALNVSKVGTKVVSTINSNLSNLKSRSTEGKSVILVFGDGNQVLSTTGLYVSGRETVYDDIINSLKYVNKITQKSYPLMSLEGVCMLKPDCLIIASDNVLDDRFLKLIRDCSINTKVIQAPKNPTLYPGIRIAEIYEQFLRCESNAK